MAVPLARECERFAAARNLTYINERDHFQKCAEKVLPAVIPSWAEQIRAGKSLPAKCQEWPKLGAVDLYLKEPGTPAAGVELKAGSGTEALRACAWDAIKLAFLIERGDLCCGFLIAAAPADVWMRKRLGHELFEFGEWSAEQLREHFAAPFIKYELDDKEKRGGFPVAPRVPAGFRIMGLEGAGFVIGETDWELRVAEVEVTDSTPWGWDPLT